MTKLQYPLNRFWVSLPYNSKTYTLGVGTIIEDGTMTNIVSPSSGSIVEYVLKDKGYEVWGKYKYGDNLAYISIYPLDNITDINPVRRNDVIGNTSANHLMIKTIITKQDVDKPSELRNGYRNPLQVLYRYEHQYNTGNIPYCSPRIHYVRK